MKGKILFAAMLALAACDKERISGCISCRTESYEIRTGTVPNESKSVAGSVKTEDACGDADAKRLIDKVSQNRGTSNRVWISYEVIDSTTILQTVVRCEEK